MATVDAAGLVTFWGNGSCEIVVTASKAGSSDQTFAIYLSGTSWGADVTYTYDPVPITSDNVGHYVLVLYNADSVQTDNQHLQTVPLSSTLT